VALYPLSYTGSGQVVRGCYHTTDDRLIDVGVAFTSAIHAANTRPGDAGGIQVQQVRFGRMTVLVSDLDEASAFYAAAFGFRTLFDGEVAPGVRTVHVGTEGVNGPGLWFIEAGGENVQRVGSQTGSEPALVLYLADLAVALETLERLGVEPLGAPDADDAGYRFAHVRDNSGNEIVLVQAPVDGETGS
jgi:catechol 2,3-dioxygenase-like lactoylglutathione lyase family enzyme